MHTRVICYPRFAVGLWMAALSCSQAADSLTLVRTITFPKMQGGFNHLDIDASRKRVFATAPTNLTLEIGDLDSGKPLPPLTGEKPAAVRFAPEFNQLYVTRGQKVCIYDGKALDLMTSVDMGQSLDEIQYDARSKQLYVGCMTTGKTGIGIISIPEGKLLGEIKFGKPQGLVVELAGARIFANVPELKQVAVIDRVRRVLLDPWQWQGAEGNTPLALDEKDHRLFVGCRRPPQMVVLDTRNGRKVAEVAIHGDTDDLFYDAANKRIYVSCGEGFVDVIAQHDADHYQAEAPIPTVAGARTSTFSPELKLFCLGVPRRGDRPPEIRVFRAGR